MTWILEGIQREVAEAIYSGVLARQLTEEGEPLYPAKQRAKTPQERDRLNKRAYVVFVASDGRWIRVARADLDEADRGGKAGVERFVRERIVAPLKEQTA